MTPWRFGPAPFLIAGPCVLEPGGVPERVAGRLQELSERHNIPICFKASFDKANRSEQGSPRGPGLEEGLRQLEHVRATTGLAVLTDVHEPADVPTVAEVVDVIQIPAFLCRQTDLLLAAGRTGRPVNIKKGQWASAETLAGAVDKVRSVGTSPVAVTERGTFFGYHDLVVDMRSFRRIQSATGVPVIFDATHSSQQPGHRHETRGSREDVRQLIRAAIAAGADGIFLETHPDPDHAHSDRATQWPLDDLEPLLVEILSLWSCLRAHAH